TRLCELIARARAPQTTHVTPPPVRPQSGGQMFGPFFVPGGTGQPGAGAPAISESDVEKLRAQLRAGELDEEEVELDVAETGSPFMQIFGAHGMEEMEVNLRDMLSQLPGFKGKTKRRKVKVPEARESLKGQEA